MIAISDDIIEKLAASKKIVFFTGAGISAESGIPTFRGKDGIWNKMKPEELASFDGFMRNPDLVWEWYQYRRKIISETKPNPGHEAIAAFQKVFPSVVVITQNVDNLHRRAGSTVVHELHGNIERNFCIKCKKKYDDVDFSGLTKVPMCGCGGFIRPDVVWFGEFLPGKTWQESEQSSAFCDVFFSVGTSAVVYPAAGLTGIASEAGAYLIEINIEKTDQSNMMNASLIGKSGEILPAILERVTQRLSEL